MIILQDIFLQQTTTSYNYFFMLNAILSAIALALLWTVFNQDKYVPLVDRKFKFNMDEKETTYHQMNEG